MFFGSEMKQRIVFEHDDPSFRRRRML